MRVIVLLLPVLLAACVDDPAAEKPMPGSDRDAHGCIGSAGYVWNAELGRCHRPWEKS